MVIKTSEFEEHGIQIASNLPPPNHKEKVVRDLHAGEGYRKPGDANRYELVEKVYVHPNDCLLIETEEELTVPQDVFGQVCSRASLTAEGVLVANLKIDPKFSGKLTITVINVGRRYLRIERGMAFCSVFFQTLGGPVGDTAPARKPPDARLLTSHRYVAAALAAWPFGLTFLASVAASLIAAYLFGWLNSPLRQ